MFYIRDIKLYNIKQRLHFSEIRVIFVKIVGGIFDISNHFDMYITQEYLNAYFKDADHLFLLWTEKDKLVINESYFPMEYLSLFITLSGSVTVQTAISISTADSCHLQFYTAEKPVKILETSSDNSSVGIIFSRRLWNNTLMHAHPYLSVSLIQPVLEIGNEKKDILLDYLEQISSFKAAGRNDSDPVVITLILGLFFHVGCAYESYSIRYHKKSQPKVVSEFMGLLFRYYREHKDVEFYASKLHMQKEHFSTVVKRTTGMTAGTCIRKYVVLKACAQLKNSERSVKEISIDLNFTDASHFCKFFRKYMGESPEEYRQQFFKPVISCSNAGER